MRLLTFFLFIITFSTIIAQPSIPEEKADSLWGVWSDKDQSELSRLNAMHDFAWYGYVFTQPDSAYHYAVIEYEFAKIHDFKKEMAFALNTQAYSLSVLGNYKKSIETYINSLKIHEEIGYKEGIAGAYNNIGIVYENQGEFLKAIEYYRKSLYIDNQINNVEGVAISYINIGIIYRNQGMYPEAIESLERSLVISKELKDKQGIARSLVSIGVVYLKQSNYFEAELHLRKSYEIFKEINDRHGVANSLLYIGTVNQKLGRNKEAINQFNKALSIAKEVGSLIEIRDAANTLWLVHKKFKEYKSALLMHELFVATRDSIDSEENQRALIQQEYKYKYDKKHAIDSLKYIEKQKLAKFESDKKDAEILAKRNQQYALFGGLGLTLLFAGFMYNRFRITHHQKIIIGAQRDDIEVQRKEAEKQRDIAKSEHRRAENQRLRVEEKNKEILDTIETAKRLRTSILPPVKLVKQHFEESFVIFKSNELINGNFYWMKAHDKVIMFAVAAYTGSSASGAMVNVSCVNSLNKAVKEYKKTDPAGILNTTFKLMNETFSTSDIQTRRNMSISLCVLNENTETLSWAGTQNPLWIVRDKKKSVEEIQLEEKRDTSSKPFTSEKLSINGGDAVYMYANGNNKDGIREENAKEMKQIILGLSDYKMTQQKSLIIKALESTPNNLRQVADICMIGVRLPKKEESPFTRREREVLQLLDQGMSSKLIAEELSISKSTVDTHRKKMLRKLEVNSVTELLSVARDKKWL